MNHLTFSLLALTKKLRQISFKLTTPMAVAIFSISATTGSTGQNNLLPQGTPLSPPYVADEVIVKFKPQVVGTLQATAIQSLGGNKLQSLSSPQWAHVKLAAGDNVSAAVNRYKSDPNVEYAQPNFIYHTTAIPTDTNYGQEWGLKNTAQTVAGATYATNNPGTAGKDMNMEPVWDVITDCSSVTVAVVDTGFNYNHTDLSTNAWNETPGTCKSDTGVSISCPNHGWDYVNNDNDPMDTNGHGTHVSGTIGAAGNNGNGTTGVCWSAKIMGVRVLDTTGTGTTVNIVKGVNFAVRNGAKVINMSLGGSVYDTAFNTALTYAQTNDVLVVVAAGNNGTNNEVTPTYPCNYIQANILCVAALDQAYSLASFSNYGTSSVDVGAPGTNIESLWPGSESLIHDTTLATGWSGTSGWTIYPTTYSCSAYGGLIPVAFLTSPTTWCSFGLYTSNAFQDVYKSYTIPASNAVTTTYAFNLYSEPGNDLFYVYFSNTTGFPSTSLHVLSGSSGGFLYYTDNLTDNTVNCVGGTTCTLGFKFTSNATLNYYGVAIADISIKTMTFGDGYNVIDGTSMASPHVAGLATLIRAQNPSYTYADTINSIKNGGVATPSLAGKTVTGIAVNGWGSLTYINQPTGLAAVVQ